MFIWSRHLEILSKVYVYILLVVEFCFYIIYNFFLFPFQIPQKIYLCLMFLLIYLPVIPQCPEIFIFLYTFYWTLSSELNIDFLKDTQLFSIFNWVSQWQMALLLTHYFPLLWLLVKYFPDYPFSCLKLLTHLLHCLFYQLL